MPITAALDFLLLSAIWGASFLFMHLAVGEFGAFATAFMRVAIAAAVLVPLVWARGLLPSMRGRWGQALLVGLFNSGLPFAFYAFAVTQISTGLSAILNATTPMFGALVAWAWLKDRPDASRIAGLAIGFAGVALLAGDKAGLRPEAAPLAAALAIAACLAACLCYGIAASLTKRRLAGLPPLATAAGSQVGASLALVLPALWQRPAQLPGATAWAAIAALGLLCTGIAYILFFRIIERSGPARALSVPFLVPVFAVAYGAVFLGEPLTPWMLGCGAVIVLGTALSSGALKLPLRPRPA